MEPLLESLVQFVHAGWQLVISLAALLLPWTPLAAWIVFWLFAVNWFKLRQALLAGGWIALVLIGLVMVLVWGSVAPPTEGYHFILGLKLSNFIGKTVYVTGLLCIMLLCGSLQLTGCCQLEEPEPNSRG